MSQRLKIGFVAGVIGAIILIIIMYLMQVTGLSGTPGFVGIYRAIFSQSPPIDHILGVLGFAIAGGIWALIFTALVGNPSMLKGTAFGLVPTLFLWLVIAPAIGQPLFNGFTPKGIILPLIFNVVIWGSFVGWYCSKRIR